MNDIERKVEQELLEEGSEDDRIAISWVLRTRMLEQESTIESLADSAEMLEERVSAIMEAEEEPLFTELKRMMGSLSLTWTGLGRRLREWERLHYAAPHLVSVVAAVREEGSLRSVEARLAEIESRLAQLQEVSEHAAVRK